MDHFPVMRMNIDELSTSPGKIAILPIIVTRQRQARI